MISQNHDLIKNLTLINFKSYIINYVSKNI